MFSRLRVPSGFLFVLQLTAIISLTTCLKLAADRKDRTVADKAMTDAELQGYVMAFADRYWSIMNSAGIGFEILFGF